MSTQNAINFAALVGKVKETGVDMNKAQAGGVEFEPAKKGPTRLRIVKYVELGKHKGEFQGKEKINAEVEITFELSGPQHPPRELEDGRKIPILITEKFNFSLNEKSTFYKFFQRLNHAQDVSHIAELVARTQEYRGVVYHREYKGRDGKDRVAVTLRNPQTREFSISPAVFEKIDPETQEPTGEFAKLRVDPALTAPAIFLWDFADLAQWNSIFIEGEWAEEKDDEGKVIKAARSKNVLQNKIKSALNFKGSPIHLLLEGEGLDASIPEPETYEDEGAANEEAPASKAAVDQAPTGSAAADLLNGIA